MPDIRPGAGLRVDRPAGRCRTASGPDAQRGL